MSLHHVHFGWAAGRAPAERKHKHVKKCIFGELGMLTTIMIPLVERRMVTIIDGILPCSKCITMKGRSVIAAPPFSWRAFDVPNHALLESDAYWNASQIMGL